MMGLANNRGMGIGRAERFLSLNKTQLDVFMANRKRVPVASGR
jgi:hypothetical protein